MKSSNIAKVCLTLSVLVSALFGRVAVASLGVRLYLVKELREAADAGLGRVVRVSGDGLDVRLEVGLKGVLKKGMAVHSAGRFSVWLPRSNLQPAEQWSPKVGDAVLVIDPERRALNPFIPLEIWGPRAAARAKMIVAALDGPDTQRRVNAVMKLILSRDREDFRDGVRTAEGLGLPDKKEIARRMVPRLSCATQEKWFWVANAMPVRYAVDFLERVADCETLDWTAEVLLTAHIPRVTGCKSAWSQEASSADRKSEIVGAIACARTYFAELDSGARLPYDSRYSK